MMPLSEKNPEELPIGGALLLGFLKRAEAASSEAS